MSLDGIGLGMRLASWSSSSGVVKSSNNRGEASASSNSGEAPSRGVLAGSGAGVEVSSTVGFAVGVTKGVI